MDVTSAARVAGRGALAAGALAIGALAGAVAERTLMRLSATSEPVETDFEVPADQVLTVTTSDGTELHVEINEPEDPNNPLTIVFAHGYALSLKSWHYQRQALLGTARLVFYDQRSHGKSARAEFDSHHVEQLGRDLAEVMNAVGADDNVILIGHSMGGMTVMAYADQYREAIGTTVIGVAFIATTAGGLAAHSLGLPGPIGRLIQDAAPSVFAGVASRKEWFDKLKWSDSDLGILLTRLYSFGSTAPASLGRFVADMLGGTPLDVVAEFLPALHDHDKHAILPIFGRCEVLVIVGDTDRLTPAPLSEVIVDAIPGAQFALIEDSGHMVQLERHDEVDALLLGFVDRVKTRVHE